MSADDGNAARMRCERQGAPSFGAETIPSSASSLRGLRDWPAISKGAGWAIVDEPAHEHRAQDAVDHVVEPRRARTLPSRVPCATRAREIELAVESRSRFLVETGIRGFHVLCTRGPNRRVLQPGYFQSRFSTSFQEERVFAGIDRPLVAVVGAHHRGPARRARWRLVESEKVGFRASASPIFRAQFAAPRLLVG